ncbi:hypothetical protein [Paenibacillus apiarius]
MWQKTRPVGNRFIQLLAAEMALSDHRGREIDLLAVPESSGAL